MSFVSGQISNFLNSGSAKDSGKVSAQLLKKGPFDIPDSPTQKVRENPLTFSPVQYPLDLGSNELGHYILFESGFVGYSGSKQVHLEHHKTSNTTKGKSFRRKTKDYSKSTRSFYYNIWYSIVYA